MPTVLFVCTANRCRSPVAESIFRQRIGQVDPDRSWRVLSAGTWAQVNAPADRGMATAAARFDIDLSEHRSQPVTGTLIQESDLVLTMETGQAEALRAEFPHRADRIYLLSEMAGPGYDIADPIGGSPTEYQITVRQLTRLVDEGLARIVELATSAEQPK